MAPESPSSSWDEGAQRHGHSHTPELNLNQSLINQRYEDDYERDAESGWQRHREEDGRRRQGRVVVEEYEEDRHHARQSKGTDYEGASAVVGLDLNIGQSSPEISPNRNKHSPNSIHFAPPLAVRIEASPSRSPSAASVAQGRKSASSSLPSRRKSAHRKRISPPSSPRGRRSSPSPVSREEQPAAPSPPSKRVRLRARKRSPSLVDEKQRSPSPVRRRDPSAEPEPAPAPSRKRSPYIIEEKRRSVTQLRSRASYGDPGRRPSPSVGDGRRSATPLRSRVPSVELAADRRRPPSRSVTPLRRAPSVETGRKRSPPLSGDRRRSPLQAARKKVLAGSPPVRQRERSRTRSPMSRRTPSPLPSRRTRSPQPRRRSPRRSPRRERSPNRRSSPRGRSSPGRYRGSRRDRRSSPAGRRGWSPVQNRSNGVGKPGNNLFIAGFNFITTERDLERKFSRYGQVMDVRIVRDKRSGESRGFGFLTLERDEDADAAIKALDQTEWNGRIVLVEKAKTPTRF